MYAKIINEETKEVNIGSGTNSAFYKSIGMTEMEVEQAYDGSWYVKGYVPEKPQAEINAERISELKQLLANTDYIIIKLAEDAASREEYAEQLEQRKAWRKEINELESQQKPQGGVS
jgi:predicted S18 family serine protease